MSLSVRVELTCTLQDKEALSCVKLRALLDRMKWDLAEIAQIYNIPLFGRNFPGPVESHAAHNNLSIMQAAMDIFCRAIRVIEKLSKEGPLPKELQGYAELFTIENFHEAFDLIFSETSEVRFLANKRAHRLPIKSFNDVLFLIEEACPESEQRILKLCFSALDEYLLLEKRTASQKDEETSQHNEVLAKKTDRKDAWTRLNTWFLETNPVSKGKLSIKKDMDELAIAAALKEVKSAARGGK